MKTARPGFTLIELLTVIAIIGILAAILIPVVGKVREQARRAKCSSNLRQCGMALYLYAEDNSGWLPGGSGSPHERLDDSWRSNLVKIPGGTWDLVEGLGPYIGDWQAWICGSFPGVPPVDDPANTRNLVYGTYDYYPGLSRPEFSGEGIPANRNIREIVDNASLYVLMQDPVREGSFWRANHSDGSIEVPRDDNPSSAFRRSRGRGGIHGANILFFDMSVRWYAMEDLEKVGETRYSVMTPVKPRPSRD